VLPVLNSLCVFEGFILGVKKGLLFIAVIHGVNFVRMGNAEKYYRIIRRDRESARGIDASITIRARPSPHPLASFHGAAGLSDLDRIHDCATKRLLVEVSSSFLAQS
jgi:hypothetical protein